MILDICFNGPKLEPESLSKSRTFSGNQKKSAVTFSTSMRKK